MRCILIAVISDIRVSATPPTSDDLPAQRSASATALRRLTSSALLQGDRQLVIEHAGREYLLRVTAQGKLILTA
jgi:hemin uptake protein HemP